MTATPHARCRASARSTLAFATLYAATGLAMAVHIVGDLLNWWGTPSTTWWIALGLLIALSLIPHLCEASST